MIVYRVQNENGEGPYNSQWEWAEKLCDSHRASRRLHPFPTDDFDVFSSIDYAPGDARFGCPSLDMLFDWFDGWIDIILSSGFVIAVYEAPAEVGLSNKQCMWNHQDAMRLE